MLKSFVIMMILMKNETKYSIIDCRISSTKQSTGGSLEDQTIICENYVKNRGWSNSKTFAKVYSGRKEEREDFEEIIDFIKESSKNNKKISYYVIKSIDRLTRDGSVTYEEMKERLEVLSVQLVDAYGVIQPVQNTLEHLGFEYKWSKRSPTATAQIVEAERAKSEVTDILTRMIGAEISLVQDGYKVRSPNDGYVNKEVYVDGKRKVIQEKDLNRGHFFEEAFKLKEMGWSDVRVVETLNSIGYMTKERKKWDKGRNKVIGLIKGQPMTVKRLQKIIPNPIYAGINIEKWTNNKPIKTKYAGLVSVERFNNANNGKVFIKENEDGSVEVLYNHNLTSKIISKRLKFNNDYVFDKMVLCPKGCNKPTLSSKNKSKNGSYYHSYSCNRNHYWRVPRGEFETNVKSYLSKFKFSKSFIEGFEEKLIKKYRQRESEVVKQSSKISENISDLKAQQAKAIDDYTSTNNQVIREKLEQKINDLEKRIKSTKQERQRIELKEKDVKDFISYVKYLMEHPVEMLVDNKNPERQKAIWNLFFEKTPTYEEILNGTPKLSFILAVSEKTNTSEVHDVRHHLVPRTIKYLKLTI